MQNRQPDFAFAVTFPVFVFLLCLYLGYGLGKHAPEFWGPPALYLALIAALFLKGLFRSVPAAEPLSNGAFTGMVVTFLLMLWLSFVLGLGLGWMFLLPPALFLYGPLLAALLMSD